MHFLIHICLSRDKDKVFRALILQHNNDNLFFIDTDTNKNSVVLPDSCIQLNEFNYFARQFYTIDKFTEV
jgi:hypothetical protein